MPAGCSALVKIFAHVLGTGVELLILIVLADEGS
jgi:hypothetical protein